LLCSDDFPLDATRAAAHDLATAACDQALSIAISDPLPLDRIAEAHDRVDAGARQRDRVDAGARQRVLLEIPG
jgi:NADPH2:quinone reductase